MHRHTTIIALMREFTNAKEIKQPCKTRFATNFLMLQSLIVVENELRQLVALSEWRGFHCNRVEISLKTVRIIQSDIFWEEAKEVIAFMDPLIRILRHVDSDGSTACYLYETTVRAKEKLRKLKESDGVKCFTILDLFDTRVEKNIIHPVHVLAAALNPNNLFDGGLFIETNTIVQAQECIVATMVPLEDHGQFTAEMVEYRMRSPNLFNITGKSLMKTNHPRIWWEYMGGCLPVVQKVTCRILSQPCSSSP
ncbi:uncharacterized protein LOC122077346 [Macadamia integrifolia]|uniref:uncharacterized protein LOC122077346 n=1 Tax=Macadamia integrifolia TaxID=60698 RepID=UPI001C50186F|nr:uncharacterized protein LOC122077346 [Macadamia integrifolia]